MKPTPETDAIIPPLTPIHTAFFTMEDHARKLEREKNELREESERWKAECKRMWALVSQARWNAQALQDPRLPQSAVARLANLIEEDCDRAMAQPQPEKP